MSALSRILRRLPSPEPVDVLAEYRRQADDYRQAPRSACRMTLFRAATQPESSALDFDDVTNGWGSVAESGVRTIVLPGDHHSVFEPDNITAVSDAIRSCLL